MQKPEAYIAKADRQKLMAMLNVLPEQALVELTNFAEYLCFRSSQKAQQQQSDEQANPWRDFAGMFADDPQWDDFTAAIAIYREELDAELEAEYQESDIAESNIQDNSAA